MSKHIAIVQHYESCLLKHGDTHLGVDWPNLIDAELRYAVMLDAIQPIERQVTLLDFGCGAAHMYEYINKKKKNKNIIYSGLDMSEQFISLCKSKHPDVQFYCGDVLNDDMNLPKFDYIIMNGVFTERCSLDEEEMFDYMGKLLVALYGIVEVGMAFNVMSKNVDWERNDLFHLSLDKLSEFLARNVSRNFTIRADYGLYEYTTYVYKLPTNTRNI